jgi:general stress protein 26
MSDLDMARNEPEKLLWKQLDSVHAGLLGIQGSGQLLQPMAHFADRDGRRLWFLTKRGTDLFQAVRPGARAEFAVISKAQDFHASMEGPIAENADRAMLDRAWNPVSSSWFKGKDDPELVMLALRLERAAIWASTGSTLAFAWEIAKANVTEGEPHVGVRTEVDFV